jgi:hypothetical protein
MVILFVGFEVIVEVIDAVREDGYLDLGGAGVVFGGPVLLDRWGFVESH